MITLRAYQQQAVEAVYRHLRDHDDNPVVVIPTAGGKTPVMATICDDAVRQWNGRVLVLAHVKELLEQTAGTLSRMAPDLDIGMYSAGLGRRDTRHSVIVAGIQSVYKRAGELDAFDLILIDEAHMIPPEGDGMYRQFLADAKVVNPQVRVVGLTATPFRMSSGLICRSDHFLNTICYEVGVKELIRDGYLCPLRTKAGVQKVDTNEDELAKLFNQDVTEGLTDPDAVPAPPDEPITRPGDLWILGNHRLLCGDSSSVADLDRLLDGQKIQLVNTDPPYNVRVEPRSNNAIAAGNSSFTATKRGAIDAADAKGMHHQGFDLARDKTKAKGTTKKMRAKDRPLINDFVTDEAFDGMLDAWFGNIARVLEPGRCFYIWGGYANCGNYPPFLKKHELYFSQAVIWDKEHPVLTRKDFMGAHEWCFYGWLLGAGHQFFGPNNATDLWHVKKVNPQSMVHLTEKPVELAVRAINYSSRPGENVLDLFGGSGSTLIAAEQTGRHAFLMELDPPYCDVIVQRWEEFTGRKAERIAAEVTA